MASHFYRIRVGRYADTLFWRSKRDLQQRLLLRYNLMKLGRTDGSKAPIRRR
ncbi:MULTISPECIES: hypothetical protein [unclassified Bradyrhizobium]|uniref:hypothetical protein n=1 Tax=unclassified Bradyrhizobium TaxID=2631580 RepID=UPI003399C7AF